MDLPIKRDICWFDGSVDEWINVEDIKELPSARPDKTVIDKCLFKINSHISPHTSTTAVIEIKYYMQELYEEIYGKGAKPKWMN